MAFSKLLALAAMAVVAAVVVVTPVAGNYSLALDGVRAVADGVIGEPTRAMDRVRDSWDWAGKEVADSRMPEGWAKNKIQEGLRNRASSFARSGMDTFEHLVSGAGHYTMDKAREAKDKACEAIGESSSCKSNDEANDTNVPEGQGQTMINDEGDRTGPAETLTCSAMAAEGVCDGTGTAGGGTKRKASDSLHRAKKKSHQVMIEKFFEEEL